MPETNAYVPTAVDQTGAGTVVIVAAEAAKRVFIHEVNLSLSAAGTITIQDSDATAFGVWDLAATGRVILSLVDHQTLARALAVGKGLSVVNGAGNMKGFVTYSKA